jgi:phosphoribosylanthranilate isomerase
MHLRIKICGITSPGDACQAALLGADAVGLNFYSGSQRFVPTDTAATILSVLPPFVEAIALYVNKPLDEALAHARQLARIGTVQWHGDIAPAPPEPPVRFLPAFPVRDRESLENIRCYLERCRQAGRLPVGVLVDGQLTGVYGGTGKTAPWELLSDFRPEVPLILAGGLTPNNVAEAVRLVRPYAVDVASGVEAAPGQKDQEKVRRFIENARAAAVGL